MSGTPPSVWDNRDRFFEPTGTTRASIVGATRPPVGYYLELPNHLVGFADSLRRLFFSFFGIFGDGAFVRQVNFDTGRGTEVLNRSEGSGHEAKMARAIPFNERIVSRGRKFLKVGGKWARGQNGSSDPFQQKSREQPPPKIDWPIALELLVTGLFGRGSDPNRGNQTRHVPSVRSPASVNGE